MDRTTIAILVRQQRGERGFDLGPGQACGQHCQRVAHVDHRVQSGAEKVVGGHQMRSPKLPGTDINWNQFQKFALLAFTPKS